MESEEALQITYFLNQKCWIWLYFFRDVFDTNVCCCPCFRRMKVKDLRQWLHGGRFLIMFRQTVGRTLIKPRFNIPATETFLFFSHSSHIKKIHSSTERLELQKSFSLTHSGTQTFVRCCQLCQRHSMSVLECFLKIQSLQLIINY